MQANLDEPRERDPVRREKSVVEIDLVRELLISSNNWRDKREARGIMVLNREFSAFFGSSAGQNLTPSWALHTDQKAVALSSFTFLWLVGLRHERRLPKKWPCGKILKKFTLSTGYKHIITTLVVFW